MNKYTREVCDRDAQGAINLNKAFEIRDKYNVGELSWPEASLMMIAQANCDAATVRAIMPIKEEE